jgi:hypothetical protein
VRNARVLLTVSVMAVSGAGCGSSGGRNSKTTSTTAQGIRSEVVSGSCSAGGSGEQVTQSCVLILGDGERFRCPTAFQGSTPTALELEQSKRCVRLSSLTIPAPVRAVIAAIAKTRACLTSKAVHALGGLVLPANPPSSTAADGELIAQHGSGEAFIAFYTDLSRARQLAPEVLRNAVLHNWQVERHGSMTIVWVRAPAAGLREAVQACVVT